jgi:hypothetical protein
MALINCSECNHEVSSLAASCPHCGAPVPKIDNQNVEQKNKNVPEKHEQKPSLFAFILIIAIVAVSIYVAFQRVSSSTMSTTDSSKPRIPVGERGIIDSGGNEECIAVTEDAFDEYRQSLRAHDVQGTAALLLSGKCFTVDEGMRVLVIDSNASGLSKVRVLEGNKSGLSGWVPFEHIVKQAKAQ